MARAVCNDVVVAESDDTVVVEENRCFPPESLHDERFQPSERTSICPWKGEAGYLHVIGDGEVN